MIFSRNGRLIDVQTRTPWTSFINNDRYIKVEIEFAAALDEHFGVTTAKQQVTVSPLIWDLLSEAGLPKAISNTRTGPRREACPPPRCPGTPDRRTSSIGAGDGGQRPGQWRHHAI